MWATMPRSPSSLAGGVLESHGGKLYISLVRAANERLHTYRRLVIIFTIFYELDFFGEFSSTTTHLETDGRTCPPDFSSIQSSIPLLSAVYTP
jgi:hypothetical protein